MEADDIMKWQLVPKDPTKEMVAAALKHHESSPFWPYTLYRSMLLAAPMPECEHMTKEDAQSAQAWKGMDGATAWHLIERHADGWGQVGAMMEAWLSANADLAALDEIFALIARLRVKTRS